MINRTWHSCHPVDLNNLARGWFLDSRRIELQKLAIELGISRATAYRWAGSAEQLVGEVLASLVDDGFQQILSRTTSVGRDRVLEVLNRGMHYAHGFQPLAKFLADNAQLGLKIVASSQGPVQKRTIANLQQLLEEEVNAGHLVLTVEVSVMAYALTRMVESFLYADLITGAAFDLENATKILQLMLPENSATCRISEKDLMSE